MNVRKNVYKLSAADKSLQWYAKAVIQMKKLPATNPLSWSYQAAMHGFNAASTFWQGIGSIPGLAERNEFWLQCQHGTWFFLPWHRMYLAFFEQIVAKTIVDLGGPADWTLPYWNYSDTTNANALTIPPAFTNPGNALNGLWMKGRQNNKVPARWVTLEALDEPVFTGNGTTSLVGFGGPVTSFQHSGGTHGALESQPHDLVHVAIGGAMGDPRTAGLDPIFWLHHCNIDRLWQVWLNQGNRLNPPQSSWMNFKFAFHNKNGNRVEMKVKDVMDTRNVLSGYTYQGVPPGIPPPSRVLSLVKRDFSIPLEIVAATNKTLSLGSKTTTVQLKLSAPRKKKENFMAISGTSRKPQATILHFENITGKGIPPVHDVYLNVPESGRSKVTYYAGSLAFFGVEEASKASLHHSGSGQHYALDVTKLLDKLRTLPNWKEQELDVSLEPTQKMDKNTSLKIGRISLYSE